MYDNTLHLYMYKVEIPRRIYHDQIEDQKKCQTNSCRKRFSIVSTRKLRLAFFKAILRGNVMKVMC